jgi:hypothetical protein
MPDEHRPTKDERVQTNQPTPDPQVDRTASLAEAQLEKLRLEIESLRHANYWGSSVGRWIPIATVLIAVAGFLGGIYQFNVSQNAAQQKLATDQEQAAKKLAADQQGAAAKLAAEQHQAAEELVASQQTEARRLAAEQQISSAKLASEQQTESRRLAFEQRDNLNQLQHDLRMANEARSFELQKPYWEKQLELYFSAAEVAATIATTSDQDEKIKAERKFWQLYGGPLSILEDELTNSEGRPVEKAMVKFGRCMKGSTCGSQHDECSPDEIHTRSLNLAHTIRSSVSKTWRGNSTPVTGGDIKGKQ